MNADEEKGKALGAQAVGLAERATRFPVLSVFVFSVPLCLCGSLLFLFFYRLAERDLWSSHEARAAQNAQSILDTGDWVLPRLYDHRPELQKPPLYYWLVASLARLGGGRVNAWAVRLPAALAGFGCVLGLYLFVRGRGRAAAGQVAALVLASAVHFTWLARVGRIDMPLTLAVTVALCGYYQGRRRLLEQPGRAAWPWFLVAYLAVAAAVLLKGPIGAVLPGVVVVAHLLVESKGRRGALAQGFRALPFRFGLWWGVLLVAAITVPWFWWINVQTRGELGRVFFWYHNIERGFGGSGKLHAHPWWFYVPRFACDFLPWSPVLLVAAWYYCRQRTWRRDAEARFGLVWLLSTLFLLSCMRFKRADYLLPAYPGAALFLGCMAEQWAQKREKRTEKREQKASIPFLFSLFSFLCSLFLVAGWWIYLDRMLSVEESARGYKRFAAEIRRRVPAPLPVILFRTKPHTLTFHLGKPVDTLLEWENLDWWAGRAGTYYVVMPPAIARERFRHLKSGRLVEVLRSRDLGGKGLERSLVLFRTQPYQGSGVRRCPSQRHCLRSPTKP